MTDNRIADSTDLELLSFRLGGEDYSLDIMSVREIRGWTRATPLPQAPPYMRGVINLRGTVLPVIDLAARLGMDPVEGAARNAVVVAQSGPRCVGLLVDAVSDILALPRAELQPPPALAAANHGFVQAIALVEGRMLRVLDLDAILPPAPAEAA
ncbi:chemotaxis protein CheW [Frigidibacter oleivorans]|uniref:chemotaxis protein CheW n=1 Tax=Frigidibacter oleivorans TaxID=2487129 RepID=UPI000F8EBEEE|nr:chemotaxis protein CheW [Frigidibacter oleivorans]